MRLGNPPLDEVEWVSEELARNLKGVGVVTLLDLALASPDVLESCGLTGGDALRLMEKASEGFRNLRRGVDVSGSGGRRRRISTGSSSLDQLLGRGISTGRVTEIYGASGVGKTQLCFQLCVNAQLPAEDAGDIIFVDTVGTFRPERIAEIAEGRIDEDELFRHIFVIKARSSTEQIEAPRSIDGFISSGGIKMLIIDTLTDNFVYEFQGDKHIGDRQSALARHLHDLAVTALDRDVAVVVTNTVRTRMPKDGGESYDVETGGNTVSQGIHVRLRLERVYESWAASLRDGEPSARFKIGKNGIMDWEV